MSELTITVRATPRWWWRYYLWGLLFAAIVMDAEPDYEKVGRVMRRAFKLEVVR